MFVLGLGFNVQAQQFEVKKLASVQLQDPVPQPLVLVNEQETATNALILNPNDIEHVEVVKGGNALNRFGEKATDGAVIIDLKQELPLVRLKEVYQAFKVPKKQQKLTLAINGNHVKDPALLLADLRQIDKIEVAEFSVTTSSRWSFDEQYLNIITRPQP
ncbi:hypothetical protein A3841_08355 [Pontibacter flavimaris]|uniref:TonB-dependent receptor n=1 Tax=Pontibacter flavimaris TaxID=1797110 RepID=A0A1Q5PIH5_9BACT|nr:hypothetical protein A3841_08355 [Pontibacter flavimaris]